MITSDKSLTISSISNVEDKAELLKFCKSVQSAFDKLCKYTHRDLTALDSVEYSISPIRQTVLSGGTDSTTGLPNYLSAGAGLSVNVDATPDPIILSFANGYTSTGAVDYVEAVSTDESFDSLTPNTNPFLYYERTEAGVLTRGHSIYPPQYSNIFIGTESEAILAHFEGSNGATAFTDSYGNEAVFSAANCSISTAQYKFGSSSIRLAGTNGYIQSKMPRQSNCWTLEFWFRLDAVSGTQTILSNANAWDSEYPLVIYFISNKLVYYLSSDGSSWNIANAVNGTKTSWTAGQWYHFALVFDGAKYKAYLDGAQDFSVASTAKIYPSLYWRIGLTGSGSRPMTGYIDELRFVPRALYTSNFTPPAAAFTEEEQHWFCIPKMTMYKGNPTTGWTACNRLFVGECTTGASSVSSVVAYALRGRYQSPIFLIARGTLYSYEHNVGTRNCRARVLVRLAGGTNWLDLHQSSLASTVYAHFLGGSYGIGRNTIKIRTANNYLICNSAYWCDGFAGSENGVDMPAYVSTGKIECMAIVGRGY